MDQYRLFKFRAINKHLIDSLVNSELHFALPQNLNDPFDCQVDIKRSLNNAIMKSTGVDRDNLQNLTRIEGFFDEVEKDIRTFAVCAFSLELENSLLWSHYGNEHRGLCLMYCFPESFISYTTDQLIGISVVDYKMDPLTQWFMDIASSLREFDFEKFATELVKKVLVIKDECWSYEREVRIIRKVSGGLPTDKNFLRQICFGMNTPVSDINLIRKLVSACGYEVAFCQITRSETDFGIKAVEI